MKDKTRLLLYRYRHYVGLLLFFAALINFSFNFSVRLEMAAGIFLAQMWTGQAVYQYARGGRVTIGPGGLDKDAAPLGRAALAGAALFLYLLFFIPVNNLYGI